MKKAFVAVVFLMGGVLLYFATGQQSTKACADALLAASQAEATALCPICRDDYLTCKIGERKLIFCKAEGHPHWDSQTGKVSESELEPQTPDEWNVYSELCEARLQNRGALTALRHLPATPDVSRATDEPVPGNGAGRGSGANLPGHSGQRAQQQRAALTRGPESSILCSSRESPCRSMLSSPKRPSLTSSRWPAWVSKAWRSALAPPPTGCAAWAFTTPVRKA